MNVKQSQNPFKGLYPYEEKERLYGRDREAKALFKLVKSNILTVVFGKSGIGKTSLLNAGLFPKLRNDNFLPISIRLDYNLSSKSLLTRVVQRIQTELADHVIKEMDKLQGTPTSSYCEGETLWEYFHRVKHVNSDNTPVTLVLVLDQFEEFFILGKNHPDREKLIDELYFLVEEQMPDTVQEKFIEDEEVYPYIHTQAAVRLVLGLREDYLPHLNSIKQTIPSIDRVLFRLLHLNGKQAREVIGMPHGFSDEKTQNEILRQFYPEDIKPVETVSDEKLEVEPSLLSLLCYQMKKKGVTSLSKQEKDAIFSDFYDGVLEKLPRSDELARFIETRLLNEGGFRTLSYLERDFELREAVEEAVNQKILRKVYIEEKENVEIIHDVLVPVIKERRKRREEEKNKQEERKHKRQIIFRILAIAGIISLIFGIIAVQQWKQADQQYMEAESNRLAGESFLLLPTDNIKTIRIAEVAYRMRMPHPSPYVHQALSAAAYSTIDRPFYAASMIHENIVFSSAFSPNGASIITTSLDNTVKLWDLNGNLLTDLKNTDKAVNALFSPDGSAILTMYRDKTVKLWDLKGNLLVYLDKHTDQVSSTIFSPDGTKILTSSWDNTAKLWNLKGNLLADLKHKNYIPSAVFSPNGTMILTASWDNTAKLWDLRGNILADLKHKNYVCSAAFSPDGTRIITASFDKTAKMWNLKGDLLTDLNKHTANVLNAVFSPDGKSILTCSGNIVRLWNLQGDLLADLISQTDEVVNDAVFSPAPGDTIIITCSGYTAKLWDMKGNSLADLMHKDKVMGVGFSPDGKYILTWAGKSVLRWDLKDQLLVQSHKFASYISTVTISPDATKLLTWSGNSTQLWNLSGQLLVEMRGHTAGILSATFSPNGTKIITASYDKTAKLWDLHGKRIADILHTDKISSAVFSFDGSKIITTTWDRKVLLWDLQGKVLSELSKIGNINRASLSPDGTKILTTSDDKNAVLWDLEGHRLTTLYHKDKEVTSAVFSPDGNYILTASLDNTAKLWDLKGKLLADLKKHTEAVTGAVFSPDGSQILTYSEDNTAKLWDLEGNLLADLNKHTKGVLSAEFTPDGQRIITVSKDGTVKRWFTPDAIIQWLKTAPIPKLSPGEKESLGIKNFDID